MWNFKEHLFYKTPLGDWFCKTYYFRQIMCRKCLSVVLSLEVNHDCTVFKISFSLKIDILTKLVFSCGKKWGVDSEKITSISFDVYLPNSEVLLPISLTQCNSHLLSRNFHYDSDTDFQCCRFQTNFKKCYNSCSSIPLVSCSIH